MDLSMVFKSFEISIFVLKCNKLKKLVDIKKLLKETENFKLLILSDNYYEGLID